MSLSDKQTDVGDPQVIGTAVNVLSLSPSLCLAVCLLYTSYAGSPWLSKNHPHLGQQLLLIFPTPPLRPAQEDRKVYEIVSAAEAEVVSGEVGKETFFLVWHYWADKASPLMF